MNVNKHKHMDYIQEVINRMASNSFQMKGWAVTVITVLFAISIGSGGWKIHLVGTGVIFIFWGLNAYYLRQERLFRKLYDKVRKQKDDEIDYSMDTVEFEKDTASLQQVMISKTLLGLYLPLIVVEILLLNIEIITFMFKTPIFH